MRLQKYLADCGVASRRKSEELIKSGSIKVNGQIIDTMGYEVMPKDIVSYNGKRVTPTARHVYYLMYKPRGVVCSCSDDRGRKTVMDFVRNTERRVYPVGRLDYDSEGMVLLTDDGDYANKVAHPSNSSEKEYRLTLNKPYSQAMADQLLEGIDIGDDRPALAKSISFTNRQDKRSGIEIVITEGRNRQLKRMFEAQGYEVLRLKRVRIGALLLDDIKPGSCKRISPQEAEKALEKYKRPVKKYK